MLDILLHHTQRLYLTQSMQRPETLWNAQLEYRRIDFVAYSVLHYKPAKAIQIANVCAALHNICIEYVSNHLNKDLISLENNLGSFESNYLESAINAEASAIREQIKQSFL